MKTRLVAIALLLVVFPLLVACGARTRIPASWTDPSYRGASFRRLFVIGIGENDLNRRLFEDRFSAALSAGEAVASPSYGDLPESSRLTREQVLKVVEGGDYDGVVVTRLLGVEDETEYVPPQNYPVARGYGSYYGYYGRTWDVVREPGYTVTYQIFRLETHLYDARGGELVWSGQSETFDPRDVAAIIDSVTEAVADHLASEGLVP